MRTLVVNPARMVAVALLVASGAGCTGAPAGTAGLPEPGLSSPGAPTNAPATTAPAATLSPIALTWSRSAGIPGATWDPATGGVGPIVRTALAWSGGDLLGGEVVLANNAGSRAGLWFSSDGTRYSRIDATDAIFEHAVVNELVMTSAGILAVGASDRLDPACDSPQNGCNTTTTIRLWTSTDGRTWQTLPSSADFGRGSIEAVAAGPLGIVAIGTVSPVTGDETNAAWFSADGNHWQAATLPLDAQDAFLHGAAALPGGFVLGGGGFPSNIPLAFFSADGLTWTEAPVALNGSENQIVRIGAGSGGLAGFGSGAETAWSSVDGRSWQVAASPTTDLGATSDPPLVTSDGTRIVVLFGSGESWLSADGQYWIRIDSGHAGTDTPDGAVDTQSAAALGPGGVILATNDRVSTLFNAVWYGAFGPP
jgi:hypothetical protein